MQRASNMHHQITPSKHPKQNKPKPQKLSDRLTLIHKSLGSLFDNHDHGEPLISCTHNVIALIKKRLPILCFFLKIMQQWVAENIG